MNDNQEIIKLRFKKAKTALSRIDVLIDNEFYDIVANRVYYACFYSATAALLNIDIKAHTHKGVQQMFGLHFVKTGKVSHETGDTFSEAFFLRQLGDYDDYAVIDGEKAKQLFERSREFVSKMEQLTFD